MKVRISNYRLHTAVLILMCMMLLIPASAAVKAAPAQQTITCTAPLKGPYQSGSFVVATVTVSCTGPSYIYVKVLLQAPDGTITTGSATCYGATTCSATARAPLAYGTWTASIQGYYNSLVYFPATPTSATITPPQPSYWLKLQSIECVWTNDAVGGDEPRLYVNGVHVWSDDYFEKGDVKSLTGISRIRFSGSSLPILVKEYDTWPDATITLNPWPGYAFTDQWDDWDGTDRTMPKLTFTRGGANYVLRYLVVYEV